MRDYIMDSSFFVFCFLLAIFCAGVGSTLGLVDFLVAFATGNSFTDTEKMDPYY